MDVHCEFDPQKLYGEKDPTQAIAEVSRRAAEEEVGRTGGTLRHPDPREVHASKATRRDGVDVFVVATRWLVDVPND